MSVLVGAAENSVFNLIPTESDGTLLLSAVQELYPNAVGLKYKERDGSWTKVEKERKIFFPPVGSGWAFRNYVCYGEGPNGEEEAVMEVTSSKLQVMVTKNTAPTAYATKAVRSAYSLPRTTASREIKVLTIDDEDPPDRQLSPGQLLCPPGEEGPPNVGPPDGLRDWSKENGHRERHRLPRVLTCADFTTLSWVEDMRNFPRLYYSEPETVVPAWLEPEVKNRNRPDVSSGRWRRRSRSRDRSRSRHRGRYRYKSRSRSRKRSPEPKAPGTSEVSLSHRRGRESPDPRNRLRHSSRSRNRSRERTEELNRDRPEVKNVNGSAEKKLPEPESPLSAVPAESLEIASDGDEVMVVEPEPKPAAQEIILSSEDETEKPEAEVAKSPPRDRSRSLSLRSDRSPERRPIKQEDLRYRLRRDRSMEEDRRHREGDRRHREESRRDRSVERRQRQRERERLREERWRLENERREIRDQRHRLKVIRQEKERDSAWMEKSDDFLKKLGIPQQGQETTTTSTRYSMEREELAFGFTSPAMRGGPEPNRSPSPSLEASFGRQSVSSDTRDRYRRPDSYHRELSPSDAAFFVGDDFSNLSGATRSLPQSQESPFRRSLSPSEQMFRNARAAASYSTAAGGSRDEQEAWPVFGKPHPNSNLASRLASFGVGRPGMSDGLPGFVGGRSERMGGSSALMGGSSGLLGGQSMLFGSQADTGAGFMQGDSGGTRLSGLSSLKQALSRVLNQTAGGQDIDLRSAAASAGASLVSQETPDLLKPGNYVLVTVDLVVLGSGLQSCLYQLGAYGSLGDEFLKCVLPEPRLAHLGENFARMPLIKLGDRHALHNRHTRAVVFCEEITAVLESFLAFMEKMRQRTRPFYDGVILIAYSEETTPALLQQLERRGLLDRFWRTVAGIGHLRPYMKEAHSDNIKLLEYLKEEGSRLEDMPLEAAYWHCVGLKCSRDIFCDLRANYCYQILLHLLQKEPSYQNFYRFNSFPKDSAYIRKLANYRTPEERYELYLPLQEFISREITAQRADMDADPEDPAFGHETPGTVARNMCQSLLDAGLEFDQLLAMAQRRGQEQLELHLRTLLLQRMAGQSRQVVNSTIQTTRLVVSYFRRHGHKTREDLVNEAVALSAKALTAEESGSSDSRRRSSGQSAEDTDELRTFIHSRLKETSPYPGKSLGRAQQFCEGMLLAGINKEKLTNIYTASYSRMSSFTRMLKGCMEREYELAGGETFMFETIAQIVFAFCRQAKAEDKRPSLLGLWGGGSGGGR